MAMPVKEFESATAAILVAAQRVPWSW